MLATPRKRDCSKEKYFDPLANKTKQICLPIDKDEYEQMVVEPVIFRSEIEGLIAEFPELFPQNIGSGYTLHDILPASQKMPEIRLRRIKLCSDQEVFTIRPSFVMPYMTGYTHDVEKALFLRKWTVPPWALAYVFGRDENYWPGASRALPDSKTIRPSMSAEKLALFAATSLIAAMMRSGFSVLVRKPSAPARSASSM